MNYIWDITLAAKRNGMKKSELFFEQGKEVSPYYEQSFPCINQKVVDHTVIEINALHRFDHLLGSYLHEGFAQHQEFKRYFFDLVVHFLCEMDLVKGMSRESLYLAQLEEELNSGVFGSVDDFTAFDTTEKDKLLPLVLIEQKTGSSLSLFRKALTAIYPSVLLYQIKEEPKRLLFYLGIKQSEGEQKKLNFIQDMFLPLEFQPRTFWDRHFGVCSVDATLVAGEIELV